MRLDVALVNRYPELSRRKAREVIEKGQVSLGGRVVREPGEDVPEGALLEWDPNRKALRVARLSLTPLFEDDDLLVVDKPAGLLSVASSPEARGEDTVLSRVRDYVRHLRPRNPFVGVVHRLDRDTSGALAFALSSRAREGLVRLFKEHDVVRRYLALVVGTPRAASGEVDVPLRDAYVSGRRGVARPGEPSTRALTRWRLLEPLPGAALLELELETGLQHQVRVHLAHLGHPILGDRVYGKAGKVRVERQMLHAWLLELRHPLKGDKVRAESPLPGDFGAALAALRRGGRAPQARRGPER